MALRDPHELYRYRSFYFLAMTEFYSSINVCFIKLLLLNDFILGFVGIPQSMAPIINIGNFSILSCNYNVHKQLDQ